jgi:hypothetical protein
MLFLAGLTSAEIERLCLPSGDVSFPSQKRMQNWIAVIRISMVKNILKNFINQVGIFT